MKKIFLALLFVIAYQSASSQVLIALAFGDKLNSDKINFGLVASPTMVNITDIDSKYRTSVDFGMFFDIKLNDRWYFHPEAFPKLSFGAKKITSYDMGENHLDSIFATGSVTRKTSAMGLPLLMRYRVAGRFFVEAGPQFNLTLQVKDNFSADVNDQNLSYENKVTDQFRRLDMGFALGAAYKLLPSRQSVSLGVRYYGGLTDIMKNVSGRQSNSAWLLNVYIPIGISSAPKDEKN